MDTITQNLIATDLEATVDPPVDEEWDEDDENYDEDEDYVDEEAEEIARRLRDQLWADINAARASVGNPPSTVPAASIQFTPVEPVVSTQALSKKEEAAISTMQAIIAFAEKDALVRATLESAIVPDSHGDNVFNIISRSVASRTIPKSVAKSISHLLVSLARSETLFSTLRHSNASAMQLDKGKRKRDDIDDGWSQNENTSAKKPFYGPNDLQAQVTDAVRIVTQTLSAHNATGRPLDPALVASVQLQLHQIFLFAVTSSAGGGADMNALQEISGLIQVIGVLSGIQIGPTAEAAAEQSQNPLVTITLHSTSNSQDMPSPLQIGNIGTAVYPCPTCKKSFSRLYSLRAHQRGHSTERPYTCTFCPSSFARTYDLKRHAKMHDTTAWKCSGCEKLFSRPDAIKRHKNSAQSRGDEMGDACANGEVHEVQVENGDGGVSKHAKPWGDGVGALTSGVTEYSPTADDGSLEEGEVRTDVITRVQSAVMSLHGLLSAHVGAALGTPPGSELLSSADPSVGQATLASVIARAQLQNPPVRANEAVLQVPPKTVQLQASTGGTISQKNYTSPRQQEQSQPAPTPSLSSYGLSNDQALMLEQAIANAAAAAQAQAEAEAALEENEDEGYDGDEGEMVDKIHDTDMIQLQE